MKNKLLVLLLTIFSIVACTSQRKIAYEFPSAMSEPVKAEYMKQCDKGQILWNINCSGCHTKKVNGKKQIPDFSLDQLIGYELRVSNPDHESGIPETNVSAEELGLIMTFLSYKKKNTVTKK